MIKIYTKIHSKYRKKIWLQLLLFLNVIEEGEYDNIELDIM